MRRTSDREGTDVHLVHATCDFCGHEHACYVGGRPTDDPVGGVRWERHICLGCLMRAGSPGGFESCEGCPIPTSGPAGPGGADA